ncbi:MAG TPA: hypothetical protein VGN42_18150 [Pirellulales bacterium]|nr:hypothetical protein [Pirellulales bacterium]
MGAGDFKKLLRAVGRRIGKRVVSDLETPPKQRDIEWRIRGGGQDKTPDTVERASQLLENLSKQTGLTFSEDEREVRVLFIEQD